MPPAGPSTQIADIVKPEFWPVAVPYIQQRTAALSAFVQSGVATPDAALDAFLAGPGTKGNRPSWKPLDQDDANVSTDSAADLVAATGGNIPDPRNDATPRKIEAANEAYIRLSRNQGWGAADLTLALAGNDPLMSVANQLSGYRARELQKTTIAAWNGVIKDNANDADDYTHDISETTYEAGKTDLSAAAVIEAMQTMGDAKEMLSLICVHSVVHARMQQNNLIDFIPDARGEIQFQTFLGKVLVVDDGMPHSGNVYDTWLFGESSTALGMGAPKVPMETQRYASAGNGGGMEVLWDRWEWVIHPVGHAYVGTEPNGGPGNGTGANQLNHAGSWDRVYAQRKQIRFARLVTREA